MLALISGGCAASNNVRPPDPTTRRYGSSIASDAPGERTVDLGPRGGEGPTVDIPGRTSSGSSGGSARSAAGINDSDRLGINARLYLSAEVPKLVVEVDAVRGFEPSASALSMLRSRLDAVVDKPNGIEMLPVESFAEDRAPWTEADLIAFEQRHRDRWSTRDAIVLYVLYVDGRYAPQEDSLGVAFKSSTYAVFIERIREAAATPLVPAVAIERAVITHEMGHVLALVNIGYRSPRPHEDAQRKGHSNNPDSVMYWAVDNVGVAGLVGGRATPPTNFDEDDRADLDDIKSGRLHVE